MNGGIVNLNKLNKLSRISLFEKIAFEKNYVRLLNSASGLL